MAPQVSYRQEGEEALNTRKASGAPWVITPEIDAWLKETIVHSTPADHGYDTPLWILKIMVNLLRERFGLWVSDAAVDLHLHALGLSYQQPCYRAFGRDPAKIQQFVEIEFKDIQKVAQELKADIAFEDESWIRCGHPSGRTWGLVGQPLKSKPVMKKTAIMSYRWSRQRVN